jgi:trehalose 6-phosphate phosphatase
LEKLNSFLFEDNNTLDNLKKRINHSEKIFMFLDYDGTLSGIRKDPLSAFLSKSKIKLLKKISNNKNIVLTIVSGRTIDNLISVSGINFLDKINLAGIHGAQILLKNKYELLKKSSICKLIKSIKKEIENLLISQPCFKLEDKVISLAIHYRNCSKNSLKFIPKIKDIINFYAENNPIKIMMMKRVIEIIPLNIDKGQVIEVIKKKEGFTENSLVICIGDDLTDEYLFKKNPNGINIKVAKKNNDKTFASIFLKNTTEVLNFLKIIEKN